VGSSEIKDNTKYPRLSVAVELSGGPFPLEQLSEETVIMAILTEIDEFLTEFCLIQKNETMTESERNILKAYLWWKTKKYDQEFHRELCGMEIDSSGTVTLIATGIIISYLPSSGGPRSFFPHNKHQLEIEKEVLTERGAKAHDELVELWNKWVTNSRMRLSDTVIAPNKDRISPRVLDIFRKYGV
jgi:hypothetical protein